MNSRRHWLRGVTAVLATGALDSTLAQAAGRVWRIGYLNPRAGSSALDAAFVRGMAELGYVVGRNLVIVH